MQTITFKGQAIDPGPNSTRSTADIPDPGGDVGDYMIAVVHGNNNTLPPDIANWSSIFKANSTAQYQGIYGRFRQAGDTFPWSFTGFPLARTAAQIVAYSGVDPTDPLDGIAAAGTAAGSGIAFQSVTPNTLGAKIIGVITTIMANTDDYQLSATNADFIRSLVQSPGPTTQTDPGGAILEEAWSGSGSFLYTATSVGTGTRSRGTRFVLKPAPDLVIPSDTGKFFQFM